MFGRAAIFLALSLGTLLASGPGAFAQSKPWSEKLIDRHVELEEFSGLLSGENLKKLTDMGEHLFTGIFTPKDGVGRPKATQAIFPTKRRHVVRSEFQRLAGPDANACSSCHNEPVIGGAGHVTANVFVSEGFTNADFDTIDPQFSNERNTNHLMGSGLVELLAREMTAELRNQREIALKSAREQNKPVVAILETKGVHFGEITAMPDGIIDVTGLEGIDDDLNVRPFSQKGVFTSLRQFTINAMNDHHGMQATERFGERWTGEDDFDEDGVSNELQAGDITALVAWQATLKIPAQLKPADAMWQELANRGSQVFDEIGCNSCHIRALPLKSTLFSDPGPLDVAGTLRASEVAASVEYDLGQFEWVKALPRNNEGQVMVPLFSDLKRHRISDQKTSVLGNELLSQRFVERDQFQTSELWGIASTAPYGHRGYQTTLDDVIRAHGGQAASSARAYQEGSEDDRKALIAFLKTLVIEP